MAIYKLGDIVKIKRGDPKLAGKHLKKIQGKYPLIAGTGQNNGIISYINHWKFKKGITISRVGTAGKVFYHNYKFNINSVAYFLDIISKQNINEKYLFFLLKTKEQLIISKLSGSAQRHLKSSVLLNISINIPPLNTQNSIIDIIEPHEELFLRHNHLVRIDTIENAEKDIKTLIDIIEPIEQLKNTINKIKLILKKHLILIYKLNQSSKEPIKNQIIIKNKKYKNEKFYCPTSLVSELSLNKENLILLDQTKKPSRADLTIEDNSFIFSKIIGENKLMIFSKAPNIVFSTGFFNIKSKNETNDHLLSFLLSNDFIYQKNQLQTGTLMQSLNKENLNKIFIKKDILYSNNLFSQLSNLINLEKNINSILKKILKIFI
ncbi:restriction endonuclease subunit S [Mesomycoplasma neurolyticum]|uniref:Restriction modification enzyme subunit S2A n=1 Tax=Mesomycoplasma neurolyticum TaxID=2120 RepID=A0A449A4G3_9BACT|nr:restriction endonuclease subunit S [Mesomycoplasma neurolyticum]VEU59118.1 restriction modification enzyme subunit S2A [Mesomycoplasma neurolyticum]VEU59858.1 restriction modification enzyme subunit S2A [Mesomycoplasma neurolyticum]